LFVFRLCPAGIIFILKASCGRLEFLWFLWSLCPWLFWGLFSPSFVSGRVFLCLSKSFYVRCVLCVPVPSGCCRSSLFCVFCGRIYFLWRFGVVSGVLHHALTQGKDLLPGGKRIPVLSSVYEVEFSVI